MNGLKLGQLLGQPCNFYAGAEPALACSPGGLEDHRDIHRLEHMAKLRRRLKRALNTRQARTCRRRSGPLGGCPKPACRVPTLIGQCPGAGAA